MVNSLAHSKPEAASKPGPEQDGAFSPRVCLTGQYPLQKHRQIDVLVKTS